MTRAMFLGLQNEGFLLSPSCQGTVSSIHTEEDIEALIAAVRKVRARLGYVEAQSLDHSVGTNNYPLQPADTIQT